LCWPILSPFSLLWLWCYILYFFKVLESYTCAILTYVVLYSSLFIPPCIFYLVLVYCCLSWSGHSWKRGFKSQELHIYVCICTPTNLSCLSFIHLTRRIFWWLILFIWLENKYSFCSLETCLCVCSSCYTVSFTEDKYAILHYSNRFQGEDLGENWIRLNDLTRL